MDKYTRMHACTHMHAHTFTNVHTHTHARMHAHTHIRTHTHTLTRIKDGEGDAVLTKALVTHVLHSEVDEADVGHEDPAPQHLLL